MKCEIIFEDWRQIGNAKSIYNTPLGLELSSGDLHSGTTFLGQIKLDPDIEEEMINAMRHHKAYPIFRIIPDDKS